MSKISFEQLDQLILEQFPFASFYQFKVDRMEAHGKAWVRLPPKPEFLRPGGIIAGPAMMALADYALYIAILAAVGSANMAVSTNLNINFLRQAEPGELMTKAKLIKLGKRLAVGEAPVFSQSGQMVAHVTATYSIPPPVHTGQPGQNDSTA